MSEGHGVVTQLWARGFASVPYPREVKLTGGEAVLAPGWTVAAGHGLRDTAVAVTSLVAGVRERFGAVLNVVEAPAPGQVLLEVHPGAVAPDAPEPIARQGYRLTIDRDGVRLAGNSLQGLFYGVQTLLQLLRQGPAGLELPCATIDDWPDLEVRCVHYDTKHHQDRLEAVLDLITRLAHFKMNAIAWEIEDKFAYQRHPVIGAPGAFTADQMRRITEHALKHFVEVIPIVQGPSHLAFVGKHEEFAHLREDKRNNYMLCPTREETYQLLFDMYDELIEATPGCAYFHIGTDEPYFLGDTVECGCRARRDKIGQSGMMAEFIAKCAKHLIAKGRRPLCWGEWPLTAPDVPRLPHEVINTVFQNPTIAEAYRANGNREWIYCPTQGGRVIFPEYLHGDGRPRSGRIESLYRTISFGPARPFNPMGAIIGTWDDCGLHKESFWLGWAAGAGYGWRPGAPRPDEMVAQFMRLFHGPEAVGMTEVYRLLDEGANFWSTAWDRKPSTRGPSYKRQWHPRNDRTLALPRLPDPDTLDNQTYWTTRYAGLIAQAKEMSAKTARLVALLQENLGRVRRNRHALEVFLTIAGQFRDFIDLIETLAKVEGLLDEARQAWDIVKPKPAADRIRSAANEVRNYVKRREDFFADLTATWEVTRYPKGQSVGGRHFIHIQDDTKNHPADWTPDLSYLIKPSRDLNLETYAADLDAVADEFLKRHGDSAQGWSPGGNFMEDGD
jgi:hexosaminidase